MYRFKTIFSMMLALALTVIIIPATVFAAEEDLVPGSTAPALSVGISNVTDIDAELTFEVTGYAGEYKIKYLVLKTSEDKPDVDTIKNTGNIAESNVAAITNLIPETAYTVYSIAYVNDANQILTGISTVQFITLNSKTSAVPVITNASAELTDGGAALNFTVNKACMYYYLVYEKETATPDAQVIKAQGEAVAKGSGSVNANEASNVHIAAEFDLSKTYTLYLVAEDEKGVFSEISMLALGLPIKMLGAGASDPVTINIETVTGNGTGYTYSDSTVTIIENGNYVITGSGTKTTNRIKVADSIEAKITLKNVNIDVSAQRRKCAFDITGATVILTLEGDNILKSGSYCAGLQASQGAMLTISADSTGTLTATGGDKSAGIGGADNSQYSDIRYNDSGNIIINGGTVNANGTNGAGIGGGNGGAGGNITITGGKVNANGGEYSAGIGSGYCKGCGTITIQGGIIHAVGGSSGPGIGCGSNGDGGNITISGGEVYANGGSNGMGIGASSGTVSVAISNGIVEAKGGANGAGIGGGEKIGPTSKTGEVYITGGNITATGGDNAAGIGANYYSKWGKITIDGGTVNAIGNRDAAGIGGAKDGRSPTDPIIIKGGNIIATGGGAGAGIGAGGGNYSHCGDVTITGGQVTATGGMYAAGIGGGGGRYASTCGLVSISGPNTVVNAKGDIYMNDTKDIGAGHKFTYLTTTDGGTLKVDDGATLNLLARGTNSSTQYIMGIIGGEGAGQSSGIYYYNRKYNGVIDMSAPGTGWYKGSGYTFSGNTVNINEAGSYCILGKTASNHIKISNAITADITLSDASIDVSGIPNSCAFDMTGATVNLALTGRNTLASGENCAGLQVPIGAVLKIVEGSTGSLSASGGADGSGIGGGSKCTAGNITILGGQIIAEGTTNGAGIGGGLNASGGTVKIGGGKDTHVVCFSLSGYDIGSGDRNSTGGSLEVNDGAMVSMLGKGTNATAKYITGTIGGKGAKLDAGVYLNSQKQLEFFRFVANPENGAKALETIRLGVEVKGLTKTLPQGAIVFKANGIIIGQTSVTRTDELTSFGISTYEWTNVPGGTQTLTAEYKQNATSDSYYLTDITSINNYEVAKINQSDDLVIKIPEGIKYHDNFNIDVSGGNGTGNLSYKVTPGDALSFNPDGSVTAQKAGPATITVTKSGDIHYLEAEKSVNIVISKVQPPAVVFPTAGELTYGQHLSAAALMGGSGDGSFAWSSPDTVPTVKNNGYMVVFTPNDTDNYDYTGIALERAISVTVHKASPEATFPTAGEITYGQSLANATLTDGKGEGSFAWEYPDTIPPVVNEGYKVIFTPTDTDNFLTLEQIIAVTVHKANQTPLSVSGIPASIAYGDEPFNIEISGGSGTGALSYEVTSGDAVTVDADGKVTIVKAGTATVAVTKAGDDNYLKTETTLSVTVNKACQEPLLVSGIPNYLTVDQTPFTIVVGGGSGTGDISFEVSKGGAVTVDANGKVTIVKTGTASITITKAEDTNYLMMQKVINLTVREASSGNNNGSTYSEIPSHTYVQDEYIKNTNNSVSIDLTKGSTWLSSTQMNTLISLNQTKSIILIGNGYSITFPVGRMRTTGFMDLNLGVLFNSGYYFDRIKAISSDSFVLMIDFDHSGPLPGEAQVKIKVGVQYAGRTLYYHYYNPLTGNLEYLQTVTVDKEGYVIVKQSHCSAYALNTTITDERPTIPETGGDSESNHISVLEDVVLPIGTSLVITFAKLQSDLRWLANWFVCSCSKA